MKMKVPVQALLLMATALCTIHAAEQTCPWLNAATAGGILEGQARAAVTKMGDDATCEFTRQNSKDKLRIEVVMMGTARSELAAYKAECIGPAAPLPAIGTDAVACGTQTKNGEAAEQIAGRVRKQAFLIRVTADVTSPREALRERAQKAAEQVAGNLF